MEDLPSIIYWIVFLGICWLMHRDYMKTCRALFHEINEEFKGRPMEEFLEAYNKKTAKVANEFISHLKIVFAYTALIVVLTVVIDLYHFVIHLLK